MSETMRYKSLMAILCITIIVIMAMREGFNGQFYSVCVVLIAALGGVEAYDLIRRERNDREST